MTSSCVSGDMVVAGIIVVVTSRVVVGEGSVTTVVIRRVVGAFVGMVVTSGVGVVGGVVVDCTAGKEQRCNHVVVFT